VPAREVDVGGSGPAVVFVHGSFANAEWLWGRQQELADSFTLVMPNRSGYPPHPPREQIDFYEQADDMARTLGEGAHLVGFSYGGVVALLTAGRRLDAVRSLTVIEPPALWLARGTPEVDRLAREIFTLFWSGPSEPRSFAEKFLPLLGSNLPLPGTLPPELEQGARALMVERPPWDARFALDEIAAAPFPKLVVSGGHSPALDAVCDVLEERLGAQRVVIPGGGHNIPQLGTPFNEALAAFVEHAESRAAPAGVHPGVGS
jgi:pimeloyl-ACP methyl ester carboxylesterase